MYGIFVNEDGAVKYAHEIVARRKPIETRTKNMLSALVGERVAIISTHRGRKPMIIGYADMTRYEFCPFTLLEMYRPLTLIPKGSFYDNLGTRDGIQGKWFYWFQNAEECEPYPLPDDAIRHGRSWCEF